MTDSEKLDIINKEVKRIKIIHSIGVIVVVLGFFGIASFIDLKSKLQTKK